MKIIKFDINKEKTFNQTRNQHHSSLHFSKSHKSLNRKISESQPDFHLTCPNCKNIDRIRELENNLKIMIEENDKFKKINKYLMITLERKDEILLKFVKENKSLSSEKFNNSHKKEINKKFEEKIQLIKHSSNNILTLSQSNESINDSENSYGDKQNQNNSHSKNSNKILRNRSLNQFKVKQFSKLIKKPETELKFIEQVVKEKNEESLKKVILKKPLPNTEKEQNYEKYNNKRNSVNLKITLKDGQNGKIFDQINKTRINQNVFGSNIVDLKHLKVNNYYEKLSMIAKTNINRKKIGNVRSSFLSMKDDFILKLCKNDQIKELTALTMNDEEFSKNIKYYSDEKLFNLSDTIGNLLQDYEKAIKLIHKLKVFLRISYKVNLTMTYQESATTIINNTCEILNCERAAIFIYDKFSKTLILSAAEGLERAELVFPSDKGIIGASFTKGEKFRIDDAYLDERFNREADRQLNYRTRSILCVPLVDFEGNRIGVIEAINKRIGRFSADDEEILTIFSNQASVILKNSMLHDDYLHFSTKLKCIIEFSLKLSRCSVITEFNTNTESLLTDIFMTSTVQVLVFNKNKNCLVRKDKYESQEKHISYGIVGQVFIKKELIGLNSIQESIYFNNLVDLETGYPLVTFPILDKKENILAIVQTAYPKKMNPQTNRPKDNDLDLIHYYSTICAEWLENRINDVNFF